MPGGCVWRGAGCQASGGEGSQAVRGDRQRSLRSLLALRRSMAVSAHRRRCRLSRCPCEPSGRLADRWGPPFAVIKAHRASVWLRARHIGAQAAEVRPVPGRAAGTVSSWVKDMAATVASSKDWASRSVPSRSWVQAGQALIEDPSGNPILPAARAGVTLKAFRSGLDAVELVAPFTRRAGWPGGVVGRVRPRASEAGPLKSRSPGDRAMRPSLAQAAAGVPARCRQCHASATPDQRQRHQRPQVEQGPALSRHEGA